MDKVTTPQSLDGENDKAMEKLERILKDIGNKEDDKEQSK